MKKPKIIQAVPVKSGIPQQGNIHIPELNPSGLWKAVGDVRPNDIEFIQDWVQRDRDEDKFFFIGSTECLEVGVGAELRGRVGVGLGHGEGEMCVCLCLLLVE